MSIHHRRIPTMPERPRVHPIAGHISRSYPIGRQNFSRAYQGETLILTISTEESFPEAVMVSLVTTLNSKEKGVWAAAPFQRVDAQTQICHIVPQQSGLFSFRAEFSLDGGATWLRDTVPDAWILIDPPQLKGLRLYTLIPNVSGSISDWKKDLRRIADLGFNAIHLLPVTPVGKSESPYAAKDLFGIDPRYLVVGSAEDGLAQLEEYAEEAFALGIRLCFDLVFNHVGVDSTMARRAPDWIVPDQLQPDGFKRAGFWSAQGWCMWQDLALINYEHPSEAMQSEIFAYMTDYALFWAKYANDTWGFVRFDNLHSSDTDFVLHLANALHTEYPDLAVIAEYFTDEHTLLDAVPKWGLNLVLATPWNYRFVPDLRNYLSYIHRQTGQVQYIMPITTHDSGSPAEEFGTAQSTVPRYVAAALMGNGATGIAQGVEFGNEKRADFIGTKPKMEIPAQAKFGPFILRVNSILAEYEAFQRGANFQFVDNDHHAILAAFRIDPGAHSLGFLVICNFDISLSQKILIDLSPFLGTDGPFIYDELISHDKRIVPTSRMEMLLGPCEAQVLRFQTDSSAAEKGRA